MCIDDSYVRVMGQDHKVLKQILETSQFSINAFDNRLFLAVADKNGDINLYIYQQSLPKTIDQIRGTN